jgi:hypothetical protein
MDNWSEINNSGIPCYESNDFKQAVPTIVHFGQ